MLKILRRNAVFYKLVCFVLSIVVLLSTFMTGSYAWNTIFNKENVFSNSKNIEYSVALFKYERDSDGNETENPIPGTLFFLYRLEDGKQIRIGADYISDEEGKIEVFGLFEGDYIFVEQQPSYGYTYDKDNDGHSIREYGFTINNNTANKKATVTAYNTRVYSELEISKTIINSDGSAVTEGQKNTVFEFTVQFSAEGQYRLMLDNDILTVESGDVIYLRHGQTAIISGLPVGTLYSISEKPLDGYSISSTNHQGNITITGAKAEFINTYTKKEPCKTTLIVKKRTLGEGADLSKEFNFTVIIDGEEFEFTLKHAEEKSFELPAGALYEVYEDDYSNDGYVQSSTINGYGTGLTQRVEVIKTNAYKGIATVDISGEKTWDMNGHTIKKPESITIHLMNGETIADSAIVKPDSSNKWLYSFTAPKYDDEGNEIKYTVKEEAIAGYISDVRGYNIKNTLLTPAVYEPLIKKSINGDLPETNAEFSFKLAAEGEAPMPAGTLDGVKIIKITGEGETGFGEIYYTAAGVYVYSVSEVNSGEKAYTYDETLYTLSVTVEESKDGFKIKSAIFAKPDDADEYDTAEFINIYTKEDPGKASVKVSKKWKGTDPERPESVQVQLYGGGEAYGDPIVLSDANNWTHTWINLDKEIVWTLDELNVPENYKKEITGNAQSGFIINNIYDGEPQPNDEKITIKGSKTWIHGSNPSEKHPSGITIFVKAGDSVVVQKLITANNGWKWSFELPKYDENGKELQYSLDEAVINAYSAEIDGYNITNRYIETGDPNDPDGNGKGPKTGDSGNMTLWFCIMIISAFCLRWMLSRIAPIKKKKERNLG